MRDDLVDRQFAAEAANQLWLADITERWVGEGNAYRCARAGEVGRIAHRRLSPSAPHVVVGASVTQLTD